MHECHLLVRVLLDRALRVLVQLFFLALTALVAPGAALACAALVASA